MKRLRPTDPVPVVLCPKNKCGFFGCTLAKVSGSLFCWDHHEDYSRVSCMYNCGLYFPVGFPIEDHDCKKRECEKCGFYFASNDLQSHRCRNEQCDVCKLWYVSLKNHKCRKKNKKTCPICFDKFFDVESHMEKKHSRRKHIIESKVLPVDLANIVTRYVGDEKLYWYCAICLKDTSQNPGDMHKRPFKHRPHPILLSENDRNQLEMLRQSQCTLESALRFRSTGYL